MRDRPASPRWKRLLWFFALWAGGVLAVSLLGWSIKALLPH